MISKIARTLFIFGMSLVCTIGASARDIPGPHGIYVLGQKNSGSHYENALNTSGVDFVIGSSYLASWAALHPAPGVFDFSAVITQLHAVEANGDKLTLEILLFDPPQHVIDAADETVTVVKGIGTFIAPAPWDASAQASYVQMLDELANTPVLWTAPDGRELTVRLADHPSLETVTATIVGISSIRDPKGEFTGSPTYTREKFLDAVDVSVRASRERFPTKFGFLLFAPMNDAQGKATADDTSDDLDEVLFQQLMSDYNNPGQLHLGFFGDNLADARPNPDLLGAILLRARDRTYTLFQALTAWSKPADSIIEPGIIDSGTPLTGIDFALTEYGATYFEIYFADVTTASLHEDLRAKADELATLAAPDLVAAVLPQARAVQTGQTASVFATIINVTGHDLANCAPALPASLAGLADFSFQTVDAANQLVGTANTAIGVLAGKAQGYVIGVTPLSPFAPQHILLDFICDNAKIAAANVGVNTLLLGAKSTPGADMLAIAATPSNPGVAEIDADGAGAGFFTIAAANIGAAEDIVFTADTGLANAPVIMNVCQTDPATSVCLAPPAAEVQTHAQASEVLTFGVFISGQGFAIPFDPGQVRAHARFSDSAGQQIGSTSVALQSITSTP